MPGAMFEETLLCVKLMYMDDEIMMPPGNQFHDTLLPVALQFEDEVILSPVA